MAASLPATIIMGLFFAALFYAFIPGNLLSIPNATTKPDSTTMLYHSALFAVALVLLYEIVANYIYKNI